LVNEMRVSYLREQIRGLVDSIRDEKLRSLVRGIIENPRISTLDIEPAFTLDECPGEIVEHHSYPGGLLQHTLSVALIARYLSKLYEEVYGVSTDIDLITACSLLHDIYKVYEYEVDEDIGGYRRNRNTYIPHDYLVVGEMIARSAPIKLIRCLSEVHGYTGYTMFESLIVSKADQLDAHIIRYLQESVLSNIEKEGEKDSMRKFYDTLRKTGWKELLNRIFL